MSPPPALTEDEEVSGCSEECESVRRRTCLSYSCIQTRWILFPPLPQSVFPLCFVCMLKPGRREQQESVSLHRRRALCWEVSARRSSRDTSCSISCEGAKCYRSRLCSHFKNSNRQSITAHAPVIFSPRQRILKPHILCPGGVMIQPEHVKPVMQVNAALGSSRHTGGVLRYQL